MYISTIVNINLIHYFTKFQADIFPKLQFSYTQFEMIKNQLIYNLYVKVKNTSVNTSSEVTIFDNNDMTTINKLKNKHKHADLASFHKQFIVNNIVNNEIDILMVSETKLDDAFPT